MATTRTTSPSSTASTSSTRSTRSTAARSGGTTRSSAQARGTRTAPRAAGRTEAKAALTEVRKPLLASVGAADIAVAKLLALPTTTSTEVRRITDRVGSLPVQASRVPTQVGTAVRALPATVTAQISDLQGRANNLYNSFATRGERRVASIRRSPSTEQATERTRTAVSQSRAARTSTRRAAEAVGRAVVDAAPQH
ncbi:hypothetical protein [Frankia sp. AgKG'84/4]|uniref:hypothetical protein n=1 Tax=Frankia sp. AgKG'84/4 TaxID=573490 RepID=UPI00200F450F|nr:hypothetical protein [Frankia sp. AgKG'84/4]MCL9796274.1 hypothetical protein [Frankia sp. AgKG'84/4]